MSHREVAQRRLLVFRWCAYMGCSYVEASYIAAEVTYGAVGTY